MIGSERLRYMADVQDHFANGGEVEWTFLGESQHWLPMLSRATKDKEFDWNTYNYRKKVTPRTVWLWENVVGCLVGQPSPTAKLAAHGHDPRLGRAVKFVEVVDQR